MKLLSRAVAVAGVVASFAVDTHAGLQQLRSEQSRRTTILGPPLPVSSLRDLWMASPVVVSGTVRRNLPPAVDTAQDVFRYQVVRITAVLKDDTETVQEHTDVRIKYAGGTVTINGREHHTVSSPAPPAVDADIVCFLEPLPQERAFVLSRGANSLMTTEAAAPDSLRVSQTVSRLPELKGRRELTKQELLGLLDGFRRGR